jgi:hypothetical protein
MVENLIVKAKRTLPVLRSKWKLRSNSLFPRANSEIGTQMVKSQMSEEKDELEKVQ